MKRDAAQAEANENGLYHELLDATIHHLEELRRQGARYVVMAPAVVAALMAPTKPVERAAPTRPVPSKPPPVPRVPARPSPPRETPTPQAPVSPPRPASQESLLLATVIAGSLSAGEKAAAMAALRARALACQKCTHLAKARRNVVFGVGDINAALMFAGEAPGVDEDIQAAPFVGAAGQLLTKIIQAMGLTRSSVYIANILKCRPDTPGQTSGNRKPTPSEMATCIPYLREQIELIQPKAIVALGGTAVEGLIGKSEGITRLRGRWIDFEGIPLMPTYHPAYLLRNQSMSAKREVWEDMLQVMERLGLPISDKQRGYFLKA